MLKINFSYGMAEAIKNIKARILEKTFKIEEELKKRFSKDLSVFKDNSGSVFESKMTT